MPAEITRFAPSPTGLLHLGHAYSAWVGWDAAQRSGGKFLLRLDDIDQSRVRPEYVQHIFEDLTWLGLHWAEPVRVQSEHQDEYEQALAKLDERGLLYPCFCTRKQITDEIAAAGGAPHGPDGPHYPGTCRHLDKLAVADRLAAGEAHVLRLDTHAAMAQTEPLSWHDRAAGAQIARPETLGDVVLARKEARNSYHLSVVIDDRAQDISLVTRGNDLFHATHMHRLLQALLNITPPDYLHHDLICDDAGKRLAKRDDARAIAAYREQGLSATEVRQLAGIPADPGMG